MTHEPCEDCVYSVLDGDHEIGLITLCEGGYHFICKTCDIHEVWLPPETYGFERARWEGMIEDMVNAHLADQLFINGGEEEEEPAMVRVPLWQRVKIAAAVLRTRYVPLD